MTKPTAIPLQREFIDSIIAPMGITDISNASIRQVAKIATSIEDEAGLEPLHLEIGVPGLAPSTVGIRAQREALERGIASQYPPIAGIAELKNEAARFIKAFIDVDIASEGCIPTVGSMQGSFALFMLISAMNAKKRRILFINPGFPVQHRQCHILGIPTASFDIYRYRAEALREKLEEYLSRGDIGAIVYSNPNNPAWICLSEEELRIIGEAATRFDAIAIEDLAYMGMDFRRDLAKPFCPPFQPSVARYTDNYILMLSASKIFSYAGERIGVVAISDTIYNREYEGLQRNFGMARPSDALTLTILHAASSGASHSAQYAFSEMMRAASDGKYDFIGENREYARRAKLVKGAFTRNGFHIVYDRDLDEPLSDGFFFTAGYGEMSCSELLGELLRYGICAISLNATGSKQSGIRVCVSQLNSESQIQELERRLSLFNQNNQ